MGPSTVLIALLCLSGADAAAIVRGSNFLGKVSKEKQSVNLSSKTYFSSKISALVEKAKKIEQSPAVQKGEQETPFSWVQRIVIQLLFGVLYYFLIVSKYPMLDGAKPTPEAVELQELDAVHATMRTSLPNCLLSWFCTGPRAAHTFHSVGVIDYWPGCILMSLFPCCTLWAANSFTDLNEKLGGQKEGIFNGLVCAFCCSCCVVAQDAQSLDLIMGVDTGFFGVETPREEKMSQAKSELWQDSKDETPCEENSEEKLSNTT